MTDSDIFTSSEDIRNRSIDIQSVAIEDELSSAYLDYAMSVIVSRALPDLRDGLKPVHRRILYAMHETRNTHEQPYRKSARPVGEVMGKYHPHGDSAIYEALVRMAQDFAMSLPLLDGQGNFGSMDGDSAAAMRYTEVRMAAPAAQMLEDIGFSTVEFQDNYDGKDREPVVLPARFPNILVNGGSGIAVGMASKIPPHNLGEVIDATLALMESPDISSEQLMELLPGPDFPTGGIIHGRSGSMHTFLNGQGKIIVRAKARIEYNDNGNSIIIDEIPYLVNKSDLVEKIVEVALSTKGEETSSIHGIRRVRDESDRTGVRVAIELKNDAVPEVVLNQLWRHTPLQSSYSSNIVVLNRGQPESLGIRDILMEFIAFREEVVTNRTVELLRRSRNRSHILCGLAVAASNLDKVVDIIRSSSEPSIARKNLLDRKWPAQEIVEYIKLIDDPLHRMRIDGTYQLSNEQVQAILDLRLQRLTAMGVQENTAELQKRAIEIREYLSILGSGERVRSIIAEELEKVKNLFAIPRRTIIEDYEDEILDDDLVKKEDTAVLVTSSGYIKRIALSKFTLQALGGKGSLSVHGLEEDYVNILYVANTHDKLLCFATNGMVYKLTTWRIPLRGKNARGLPLANIWENAKDFTLASILPVKKEEYQNPDISLVIVTSDGFIRRSVLSDYERIFVSGKKAFIPQNGVELIATRLCRPTDDIILLTKKGRAVRFSVNRLRNIKARSSHGVRGIKISRGDKVTGMEILPSHVLDADERYAYLKARRAYSNEMKSNQSADRDPELDSTDASDSFPTQYQDRILSEHLLLTIGSNGTGKLTSSHEYPAKSRALKGIKAYRRASTAALLCVNRNDQILLVTNSGMTVRCKASSITTRSRTAGGQKIIKTNKNDVVVYASRIPISSENEPESSGQFPLDELNIPSNQI